MNIRWLFYDKIPLCPFGCSARDSAITRPEMPSMLLTQPLSHRHIIQTNACVYGRASGYCTHIVDGCTLVCCCTTRVFNYICHSFIPFFLLFLENEQKKAERTFNKKKPTTTTIPTDGIVWARCIALYLIVDKIQFKRKRNKLGNDVGIICNWHLLRETRIPDDLFEKWWKANSAN